MPTANTSKTTKRGTRKSGLASTLPSLMEGYSYRELKDLLRVPLSTGISVLLRGHPGVGKSALARQLAEEMDMPLVDIRLAQREPAELGGVFFPNPERTELNLLAPGWVKKACEQPHFIFLDEINAAVTRLHQAAAYQIVLERQVGDYRFHPDTVIMAAGNLEEDNAIVTTLSSALCNRFVHFTQRVDVDSWIDWGHAEGIAGPILSYIAQAGEEALYDNNGDNAFPSPRSWELASRMFLAAPAQLQRRAVCSAVGVEASEKLFNYLKVYRSVNARAIIEQGKAMKFTSGKQAEPSFVYAAVFAVAQWLESQPDLDDKYLPNVVKFLQSPGLDPEYTFLFLRQLRARTELTDRLKAVAAYRTLAGELVSLHAGLYN